MRAYTRRGTQSEGSLSISYSSGYRTAPGSVQETGLWSLETDDADRPKSLSGAESIAPGLSPGLSWDRISCEEVRLDLQSMARLAENAGGLSDQLCAWF